MEDHKKGRLLAVALLGMLLASALGPATAVYIGPRVKISIFDSNLVEGESCAVGVFVKDDNGDPVELATVLIEAELGHFDEPSQVTDAQGYCGFVYNAPESVDEPRGVEITATAQYGEQPYPTGRESVWVTHELEVEVTGPTQLEAGGPETRYDVAVTAGGDPLSGVTVTVSEPAIGTLGEVGRRTDGDGTSWFNYTPPAEGTGQVTFGVTAKKGSYGDGVGQLTVDIVEEVVALQVSLAADGQPLPRWGSCNLTATVTRGGQPVAGATVAWEAPEGWLSETTSTTGTAGTASAVYTASGVEGDSVTVTASASGSSGSGEATVPLGMAPGDVDFAPQVSYRTAGGQLFPGETLGVEAELTLGEGIPWRFITPVDVVLVVLNGAGDEVGRKVVGDDLSVVSPLSWSSGMHHVYTAPHVAEELELGWDLLVLSHDGGHVHYRLPEPAPVVVLPEGRDDWTFLMYMAGDNDLERVASDVVDELETSAPTDEFAFLFQLDRFSTAYGSWNDTRRYRLAPGPTEGEEESELLSQLGELDMASPSTLLGFLLWGSQLEPAGHYCVVLWDHGNAHRGLLWDSTSHDHMEVGEMVWALERFRDLRRPVDVLVLDMCNMASMEVVHQVRGCTDYVAGCQNTINRDFMTPEALEAVRAHYPGEVPSDAQVVTHVLDGFSEHWGKNYFPFVAIGTHAAGDALEDLDRLGDELLGAWEVTEQLLMDARERALETRISGGWSFDTVSLVGQLRDLMADHPQADQLQEAIAAADSLLSSHEEMILHRLETSLYSGTSVSLFIHSSVWEMERPDYLVNALPEGHGWTRLQDAINLGLGDDGPTYPFNLQGVSELPMDSAVQTPQDDDSDGICDGFLVDMQVSNGNDVVVQVVVDLFAHNGSRSGDPEGLVDRWVAIVTPGASTPLEAEMSSPATDLADLVVSVFVEGGPLLQRFHLATGLVEATPRTGSPPELVLAPGPLVVTEGEGAVLEAQVTDPDGDEVAVWWDADADQGVGVDHQGATATAHYRGAGPRRALCVASDGEWVVARVLEVDVVADGDNRPPVAELAASVPDPRQPLTLLLDASGSTDPDGDALEFSVRFGDGVWAPWQASPAFEHAYPGEGTYAAVVGVRDHTADGLVYQLLEVEVSATPPNRAPAAALALDPMEVEAGGKVAADGSASSDPDPGDALEYRVDWGDGNVTGWTSSARATHAYAEAGTFTVALTVRDGGLLEATATGEVTVTAAGGGGGDGDDGIPSAGAGVAAAALALVALSLRGARRG